jgi:hypothetical protein
MQRRRLGLATPGTSEGRSHVRPSVAPTRLLGAVMAASNAGAPGRSLLYAPPVGLPVMVWMLAGGLRFATTRGREAVQQLQSPAFGRVAGSGEFVLVPADVRSPFVMEAPRESRPFALAALGTLVVGAAGLTTAVVTQQVYVDAPMSAGPRPELVRANHLSGAAGLGALGLSGVFMGVSVWSGEW